MNSNYQTIKSTAYAIAFFAMAFGASITEAANKPGYNVKPSDIVPRWRGATPGEWTMDYKAALASAKAEERFTLMMFTGMWWCPHCQALEEQVLTKPEFHDYIQSNNFYLVALDFPYRDGYSNYCWLWDDAYRLEHCAGMTAEEGTNAVYQLYAVQDYYSTPGAARQSVPIYNDMGAVERSIEYGRVGYPTLLVIKPNGTVAGRFSVSKTFASLNYVTNRIEHLLHADECDEQDDYWQGATMLQEPSCEDLIITNGTHTLGLVDKTDWYQLNVTSSGGNLWNFYISPESQSDAEVSVSIYASPTNTPLAEKRISLAREDVISVTLPENGAYYIKVSLIGTVNRVVSYTFSHEYSISPADVRFHTTDVSVRSTDKNVTMVVDITNADPLAEVIVDWLATDGSATFGNDFSTQTGTIVWNAEDKKTARQISIPLIASSVWKGDREFFVAIRHIAIVPLLIQYQPAVSQ